MCMEDKKKSPYFIAKNPCFKLSCEMFYLKFELCFLLVMLKDTVSFICTSVTFSAFLTIQIVNLMKPKGIAAAWKLIFRIHAHSAVTGNIHLSVQLGNWYFLLASIYCIPNDEKPEFLPPAFYFFLRHCFKPQGVNRTSGRKISAGRITFSIEHYCNSSMQSLHWKY